MKRRCYAILSRVAPSGGLITARENFVYSRGWGALYNESPHKIKSLGTPTSFSGQHYFSATTQKKSFVQKKHPRANPTHLHVLPNTQANTHARTRLASLRSLACHHIYMNIYRCHIGRHHTSLATLMIRHPIGLLRSPQSLLRSTACNQGSYPL